jgi:TonB family protein
MTRTVIALASLVVAGWLGPVAARAETAVDAPAARTAKAPRPQSRVEVWGASETPGLGEDVVVGVLEKAVAPLRRCYDKARAPRSAGPASRALEKLMGTDPLLGGVSLALHVVESGRVVGAVVESSSVRDDERLDRCARCARGRMLDLRFPAEKGRPDATVQVRLDFSPPEEELEAARAREGGLLKSLGSAVGSAGGQSFGYGGLGLRSSGQPGVVGGESGLGTLGTGHGGGGLGMRGTGSGGGGTGMGAMGPAGSSAAARPNAAVVTPGAAVVRGSLPREVIAAVVRRHLGEVRFCYESRLAAEPALEGRVTVQLTIGPDGAVTSSRVTGDTTGSADLGACIAAAVSRWTFPAPEGGGIVIVNYPFVLQQDRP